MPTPKFKPGQSGNPKGRPKDKTPATMLRKSISEDMPAIINVLVDLDIQAASTACIGFSPQIAVTVLEGLFSQLAKPTQPTIKVPPEKTKVETKSINSTLPYRQQVNIKRQRLSGFTTTGLRKSQVLMVIMPNTGLEEA